MKLYGGHKQTVNQSWKPAKRPRVNAETTICLLTQSARDSALLEKGFRAIVQGKEITPSFQGEMKPLFQTLLSNGIIDVNKHQESFAVLDKYHQMIYGFPISITYHLA